MHRFLGTLKREYWAERRKFMFTRAALRVIKSRRIDKNTLERNNFLLERETKVVDGDEVGAWYGRFGCGSRRNNRFE